MQGPPRNLFRLGKQAGVEPDADSFQALSLLPHERRLLQGLRVCGAGFLEQPPRAARGAKAELLLLHCQKGRGWCESGGHFHRLRAGDVLLLAVTGVFRYGAHQGKTWSGHWVLAAGDLTPDYLKALGAEAGAVLVHAGDDLRVVRFFTELLAGEARGDFVREFQASQALGYLLAVLMGKRRENRGEAEDIVNKIAETIIYMSDHVGEPVRVSELARMAGFSQAYFGELFKRQTGCSPREYLHLLRMHRACELLHSTLLSVKAIAIRLGYQDPFHFSRQFKSFQGVAPTEYRRGASISSS